MEVNEKFCVMTQEDELMVDGGIAPILIYTGALAGGWLLGHIVGYFAGERKETKMDNFKRLSMQELYDVEGGIFGVDDAIFWTLVAAGFAGGIATGVSRKNRKK